MAGQRINIMEVRTLISLKQKGWSNRKIAAQIKVNLKTIDRLLEDGQLFFKHYGEHPEKAIYISLLQSECYGNAIFV